MFSLDTIAVGGNWVKHIVTVRLTPWAAFFRRFAAGGLTDLLHCVEIAYWWSLATVSSQVFVFTICPSLSNSRVYL